MGLLFPGQFFDGSPALQSVVICPLLPGALPDYPPPPGRDQRDRPCDARRQRGGVP